LYTGLAAARRPLGTAAAAVAAPTAAAREALVDGQVLTGSSSGNGDPAC
jgi:hypothetical protein